MEYLYHADGSRGGISFDQIGTWSPPGSPSACRQSFRASLHHGAGLSSGSYDTIEVEAVAKPHQLVKPAGIVVNAKSGNGIPAVQKWQHGSYQKKYPPRAKATGDIFRLGSGEPPRSYLKDNHVSKIKEVVP